MIENIFVKRMFIIYARLSGILKVCPAIGGTITVDGFCLHPQRDVLIWGDIQKL
jgi:hypothetical protein